MLVIRHFLIVLCGLVILVSCSQLDDSQQDLTLSGATMGTTYSVILLGQELDKDQLSERVSTTLASVENQFSTYNPDSELSVFNLNSTTEWQSVSPALCLAMTEALEFASESNRAFDITVGPLVNLWGFGPNGSILEPPPLVEIEYARNHIGPEKLATDCDNSTIRKTDALVYVDFSAYAKGYAVDQVASQLSESGIDNYLIEIGGEIRTQGNNKSGSPWRIAIEKPLDFERQVQRIITAPQMAIATSGDYRNFFVADGRRFSHTIDPRTGRPVDHQLASVTVVAERAAYADAMATALMVMGPQAGPSFAEHNSIAALFLQHEGDKLTEIMTAEFEALIHLKEQ